MTSKIGVQESVKTPGMPMWRERQRSLPVGQKLELIGRLILETRQLERLKRSCKQSVRTFEERASRGDRDKFDDALTMVPNSKPAPGDELPGGKKAR